MPNWSSKPSAVRPAGRAMTPALFTSTSTDLRPVGELPDGGEVGQVEPPDHHRPRHGRRPRLALGQCCGRPARRRAPRGARARAVLAPRPLLAPVTTTVARSGRGCPPSSSGSPHHARRRSASAPVLSRPGHRRGDRGQVLQPDQLRGQPAQRGPADEQRVVAQRGDRELGGERDHSPAGAQRVVRRSSTAPGAGGHHGVGSGDSRGPPPPAASTGASRRPARPSTTAQPARKIRATPVGEHVRAVSCGLGPAAACRAARARGGGRSGRRRDGSTPRARPRPSPRPTPGESASRSGGSSITKSSVALPGERSMTSTLRMSAPTRPRAVATAPSAPGRSGSTSRSR